MSSAPVPVLLDLADFDAVGIATEIVLAVRRHAIEAGVDTAATVSAPEGWHRIVITGRRSGHLVLSTRYDELSQSRYNNVAKALSQREWDIDDDGDGVTRRFPPGTEATTVAFEILAALTVSGAPESIREVTAVDSRGVRIELR